MPDLRITIRGLRLRFGTFIIESCDSRRRILILCLGLGVIAAGLEFLTHALLSRTGLPDHMRGWVDATIVGACAAFSLAALLAGARERRKRVLLEMGRVAELNHNVRNALEVISHSHYGDNSERATMVMHSVARIERTLKELFPGR